MGDAATVDEFLSDLGATHRRVAPQQWGLTLDVAGWPLHIGLALEAGATLPSPLLRLQAEVVGPGRVEPHHLLHRARLTPLVKLTETRDGSVWVEAYLPAPAITAAELDRALGLLVEAAAAVRYAASDRSRDRSR